VVRCGAVGSRPFFPHQKLSPWPSLSEAMHVLFLSLLSICVRWVKCGKWTKRELITSSAVIDRGLSLSRPERNSSLALWSQNSRRRLGGF